MSLDDPAALLGEELLGEALEPLEELGVDEEELGLELDEDPDDAPGVDEEPDELGLLLLDEPEELGLLLLGELDEPDEDPDEPIEPDDLEPEAPVVELAPRSQP
ncbi:MAG TPA: hypothetical protein VF262_11165 [Burkholderiales bacterium]